jgi:hypothetical protein
MEKELFQAGAEFANASDQNLDLDMNDVEGRDLPSATAAAADGLSISISYCCCCSCC